MKDIFITGISRGLGLETVKHLLNAGTANIFGISRTLTPELEILLNKNPGRLHWLSCDLARPEKAVETISKQLVKDEIAIHAFINNAAVHYVQLIPRIGGQLMNEQLTVNLIAPMLISRFIIKNFLYHKTAGSIVHISSISAQKGSEGLSVYSATKAGLEAFSKTIAREFGKKSVRSNVIVAGLMDVGMGLTVPEAIRQKLQEHASLQKPTSHHTVIKLIEYLLSDDSASVTGQNIIVDAGAA